MRINKLLIAAVLAIAIGGPIVGFVGDINMAQPTTPAGERAAFFHGLPGGPPANPSGLASLECADEWLNSPPLTASALRGKVVLVDFLDLHLHQLVALASVCPRMGGEIQG
jgi:hypothetical protein